MHRFPITRSVCILKMNARGVKHICRGGFAAKNSPDEYPLSNRFDEVDTLIILDDVLIPWQDVLFYRHTRAAAFISRNVASLFGVSVRATNFKLRRYDDRKRVMEH